MQGVYHGVFAGREADGQHPAGTAWVLSRPHNWRPTSSVEHLLHVDLQTGAELLRVQIPSRSVSSAQCAAQLAFLAGSPSPDLSAEGSSVR